MDVYTLQLHKAYVRILRHQESCLVNLDYIIYIHLSLISTFYIAINITIKLVFLKVLLSLSIYNRFNRI